MCIRDRPRQAVFHEGKPFLLTGLEQGVEGIAKRCRIISLRSAATFVFQQRSQPQLHRPGFTRLQGVLHQGRCLRALTGWIDGPCLTPDQKAMEAILLVGRGVGLAEQASVVSFVIGEQPLT